MVTTSIQGLQSAATQAGDGAAIVSCIGAVNAPVASLLNSTLNLSLPTTPLDPTFISKHPSSSPKELSADVTSPISAASTPDGPLALALQALDPADRERVAEVDSALVLAVALAGVVVVPVRQAELVRPRVSALGSVMSGVERSLALRASGVTPVLPTRRLFVVVVSNFDSAEAAQEDLEAYVSDFLSETYDGFHVPSRFAGTQFADLFDLQFCLLPPKSVDSESYDESIRRLGELLRDSNRNYADAGMTVESLLDTVGRIQNSSSVQGGNDLPGDRELSATFACNSVMQVVLEKYRTTARQWKTTVESGRIIRNFGKESDTLIERTIDVFDKDASAHKATKAFARKKEELKTALLADSYSLFAKQILKLREVAYQVFRGKLARIRINDQVEKNVRGAVREAEMYFVENAESLRSTLGNWRFDNERHELVNHMRDDATERLQLARLQGNYVPSMRAPIAFAFHTLLLAPFGRDTRFAHPHAEEMQQKFDPDKIKQASLSRARPHQRTFKYKHSSGDQAEWKGLEIFEELFEDASSSK